MYKECHDVMPQLKMDLSWLFISNEVKSLITLGHCLGKD